MYISSFDTSKSIDNDFSTLTLCSQKRPNGKNTRHAQIWIEKINEENIPIKMIIEIEGKKRKERPIDDNFIGCDCRYYVFSKEAAVIVRKISWERKPLYNKKSPTYLVAAHKVDQMIQSVMVEKEDPYGHPQAFSIFGKNSLFSFKVEAYKTQDSLIKALLKSDKSLVKWLYRTATKTFEKYGIEVLKNEDFIPLAGVLYGEKGFNLLKKAISKTSEDKYEYYYDGIHSYSELPPGFYTQSYYNILGQSKIDLILYELTQCISHEERSQLVKKTECKIEISFIQECLSYIRDKKTQIYDKIKERFVKVCRKMENGQVLKNALKENDGDYLALYKSLLYHIHTHSTLEKLTPDNCFTWARDKLKIAGIDIPVKTREIILANTNDFI